MILRRIHDVNIYVVLVITPALAAPALGDEVLVRIIMSHICVY